MDFKKVSCIIRFVYEKKILIKTLAVDTGTYKGNFNSLNLLL